QPHMPVAELHPEPPLDHQEKLVLVLVVVPDERAQELDQLHLLPVQLGNHLRLPVLAEACELLGEVALCGAHLGVAGVPPGWSPGWTAGRWDAPTSSGWPPGCTSDTSRSSRDDCPPRPPPAPPARSHPSPACPRPPDRRPWP